MDDNTLLTKKERRELRRQEKSEQREGNMRRRTTRRVLFWGVVLVILGGIVFLMVRASQNQPTQQQAGTVPNIDMATDWTQGSANAPVHIIEYSDLECPACRAYEPFVERLLSEMGGSILFAYRHFPLPQHGNAKVAAYAAEAAGKQGRFWEMRSKLFEQQPTWEARTQSGAKDLFVQYAGDLGLNVDQFKNDMNDSTIQKKIDDAYKAGIRDGINATPTFFINGTKIQNPAQYDQFKALVQQALDAQNNAQQ